MKKYLKYGMFCLCAFFFFAINVNAETIKQEDIPNATYVIGTHMFTRDTNEETGYEGKLTTQLIMLASKTIKGDNLDDMIIYYKNPRGKWVNALIGEEIGVPQSFDIEYQDTKLKIAVPKISKGDVIYDANENKDIKGKIQLENFDINETDFIELYYAASENDDYSSSTYIYNNLEENSDFHIYNGNEIKTIAVPLGKHYYFKVKACKKDTTSKYICSDYSNVVDVDNTILKPELQYYSHVHDDPNKMNDTYISLKNYKNYYVSEADKTYRVSGIEIYRTFINNNGEKVYVKENDMNPDSVYKKLSNIANPCDSYVSRAYVIDATDNKIYSDYSNEIMIDFSQHSSKNNMSLEDFKNITNNTTLGELKNNYNINPSIIDKGDKAIYLYDFYGYIDHSTGTIQNVQFEFNDTSDDSKLKSKVYMNNVIDNEIDHSMYDDGDGKIEISDFDSIDVKTPEELEELLGKPYRITVIYEREGSGGVSTTEYPMIEYVYRIKDRDQLFCYEFANNGNFKIITGDFLSYYPNNYKGRTYVSTNGLYELTVADSSSYGHIEFHMYNKDTTGLVDINGEARATTLERYDNIYAFSSTPYSYPHESVIGTLEFLPNNKIIIECYVFNETEKNPLNFFKNFNIGYNKIEFTLKQS